MAYSCCLWYAVITELTASEDARRLILPPSTPTSSTPLRDHVQIPSRPRADDVQQFIRAALLVRIVEVWHHPSEQSISDHSIELGTLYAMDRRHRDSAPA